MVYCGLVSPHRSVGGDQVTLTAPRVDTGANESMRGAPTGARNSREQLKTHKHMYNYIVFYHFYNVIPLLNVYITEVKEVAVFQKWAIASYL